jgi:hypothetical protein
MLESSWVAAQLAASQEGLSSMSEWVSGMNMWIRNRLDCHGVKKNYVILYCESVAYCLGFMYVVSSGSESYITAEPSQIIQSSNSLLLLALYCCSSVIPTVERKGWQRTSLWLSLAEMCSVWNHDCWGLGFTFLYFNKWLFCSFG